jgi:hypothetical protein
MARLVAFGDAHLGRSHLAHLRDEQGRNVREEDFLRSFSWAIEETIRQEPDGFLWLGDIFDHARPTYRTFAHVLAGLQQLADAGLPGVAISGNHDTPRVRGTGSPYDALERVFPSVTFAWRMEAARAEIAGVSVHAVPQTLAVDELREQLKVASGAVRADGVNLLIAHVALTSLPSRAYRDINELEVEESAFDRAFDLVVLGHYHAVQKISKRTWYAGSTDTFSSPIAETAKVPWSSTPGSGARARREPTSGRSRPSRCRRAGCRASCRRGGTRRRRTRGASSRVLNQVDPASFRPGRDGAVPGGRPGALWQVEPDMGADAMAVQGGPTVGSLEQEWLAYVELQDLAGLERERVVSLGARFLEDARGDTA